jgi:hypothetical protein
LLLVEPDRLEGDREDLAGQDRVRARRTSLRAESAASVSPNALRVATPSL